MNISDLMSSATSRTGSSSLTSSPGSAGDSKYFDSLVAGSVAASDIQAQKSVMTAKQAERDLVEASQEAIMSRVVNQKNAMLLETRASAAKKTTDLAKEISF